MAHQDGDSRTINGVTYVRTNGSWLPQATPLVANPELPGKIVGQGLSNTRTQQEIAQSEANAGATTAKTKAEAKSAEIAAAQAQEQWNINHPSANGTEGLSGPAYMQWLHQHDPGRAAYIQGLAEGRVPFPGGQMMRSPAGQALLTQVMRADPTIDATNYTTRAAARKNAAVGNLGASDNAIVTAVGHAARLHELVPSVFGGAVTPLNSVENMLDSHLFNGKQPAYEQNAQLLGDEVAAAYGTNSQGKQNEAGAQFSSSLSTRQKNDNIHGAMDLLMSKLAANRAQFAYGNGQQAKPDFMLLPPQTRDEIMKVAPDLAQKWFSGIPAMGINGSTPPPPGGAAPPPPGSPPPGTPPGSPPSADYSGMVGGNQHGVVGSSSFNPLAQTYRNEADPKATAALAGFVRQGAPYSAVQQYAVANGFTPPDEASYNAGLAFAKQHPGQMPNVEATRAVPTTLGQRLAGSPYAAAAAGAIRGGTAGLSDVAGRALGGDNFTQKTGDLAAANPGSDLTGDMAGGAASMIFGGKAAANLLRAGAKGGVARNTLAALLNNPVATDAAGGSAYGATYGASENPNDPLGGATVGAITGGAGSLGGYGASKVLGGALNGVVNPAVQRLQAAGIPLTVGEALGPGAKKVQDAFSNIFPAVGRRYQEGRQAFNQAAFDQGGAPINANVFSTGQAGINTLRNAKSAAYSSALDPVNINLNTPQFLGDMKGAFDTAQNINPAELPEGFAANQLKTSIGNQINPDGTMTGPGFQAAYRGLSKASANAASKVEGYDVGQALGQGQDAIVNALKSDNPGAYQAFLNANQANRNLSTLAKAVDSAKNQDGQLFTPAQLGTASSANARAYEGQVAAAGGYRPFNQLINDGQSVMSSKLGDSGTFARLLAGNALLEGGGALGGYGKDGGNGAMEGAEGGLGVYALGSLFGTRAGQKLLVAALTKRPQAARSLGDLVASNPGYLSSLGAAAQAPYLTAMPTH